jgi:N-acetylneuraminate synthase
MVSRTRELEAALGDGIKKIEPNERETVIVQRRCIRAARDLMQGTTLNEEDLEMLRPCPPDGLAPYESASLIGRTMTRSVAAGEHLRRGDLA